MSVGGPGPGPGDSGNETPTTSGTSSDTSGGEADDTGSTPECPGGQQRCGDACYDLSGDPQHCGSCEKSCGAGGVCVEGGCAVIADCTQEPCPGLTYCDEASKKCLPGCAFNPQCAAAEHCDTQAHTCVCNEGFNSCGGVCIGDDPGACGATCTKCPGVANGDPVCQDGQCGLSCVPGFKLCGGTCHDNKVEPICDLDLDTCKVCLGKVENGGNKFCNFDFCTFGCNDGFIECGDETCTRGIGAQCDSHDDCCAAEGNGCYFDVNVCYELVPCDGGCPEGQICGKANHCTIPCKDDNDCPYQSALDKFCFEEYGYCLVEPPCEGGWKEIKVQANNVSVQACQRI